MGGCDSAEMQRPAIRSTAYKLITGWNGAMALIYGDASWGHATGSGKWA